MTQCSACAGVIEANSSRLCQGCVTKHLTCRVCGREFRYEDILDDLPIVQCPSCEGRAIEVDG
jgi:DNA-directed RNA polymerase subunit RPC12/RpoP